MKTVDIIEYRRTPMSDILGWKKHIMYFHWISISREITHFSKVLHLHVLHWWPCLGVILLGKTQKIGQASPPTANTEFFQRFFLNSRNEFVALLQLRYRQFYENCFLYLLAPFLEKFAHRAVQLFKMMDDEEDKLSLTFQAVGGQIFALFSSQYL